MSKKGRKSAYESKIKPHIKEIAQWVADGATEKEICEALAISVSTLNKYKAEKTELKAAFTQGRAQIKIKIKSALLKKALGFEYTEVRRSVKSKDGEEETVYTEYLTKYSPPSETAANMLMKNIDSDWKERDAVSVRLREQEFKLKQMVANDNSFNGIDMSEDKK